MLNQNIIKTALLGLNSKKMDLTIFPEKVKDILTGKEENEQLFLDALSLSFSYLEAGKKIEKIPQINSQIKTCPKETLPLVTSIYQDLLKEITRGDNIKYASNYMYLLAEKVVKNKQRFSADNLISVLENTNKKQHKKLVEAFGNIGTWIYSLMNSKQVQDKNAEPNAQERRNLLIKLWQKDKDVENTVKFLNEYFQHERINNKISYLNILRKNITNEDDEIFQFFDTYFENNTTKGKSIEQLKVVYKTFKIFAGKNEEGKREVIAIFKNIWQKRTLLNRTLKLKSKKELNTELLKLDKFSPESFISKEFEYLDMSILFLLEIINIKDALKILNVKETAYLKTLVEIKSFHKNSYLNFITALDTELIKTQNKETTRNVLKLSGNLELLKLFTDKECIDLLEKNKLFFEDTNLIKFLTTELNFKSQWTYKITEKIIASIINDYHNYNNFQLFWNCLAYLHKDVLQIVVATENINKEKNYGEKVKNNILAMTKIIDLNSKINIFG